MTCFCTLKDLETVKQITGIDAPKEGFCTLKDLETVKLLNLATIYYLSFCTLKDLETVKQKSDIFMRVYGFCTLKDLEMVKSIPVIGVEPIKSPYNLKIYIHLKVNYENQSRSFFISCKIFCLSNYAKENN